MLPGWEIIDLSHRLVPGDERFRLEIEKYFVDEYIPGYKRKPDEWYIMEEVRLSSHIGTHIEAPFHHIESGADVSRLNLSTFIGEACLVNIVGIGESEPICVEDLVTFDDLIKPGDIVLIRSDFSKYFNTPKYKNRPYFEKEAITWLADKQIKLLGIDFSGIENKASDIQENHISLFKRNIPLIEDLNNLEAITRERFLFVCLPLFIEGLDSSPLRPIALV